MFYSLALLGVSVLAASAAQVRVLYQNDLSATPSTSALLLGTLTTSSNSTAACGVYGEQPLTSVTPDIQDQLSYLVYSGELTNSSLLWIGNAINTTLSPTRFARRQASTCSAYSVGLLNVTTVDCTTALPVLCTNTPPPSSGLNYFPAPNSLVNASAKGTMFNGYRDARSLRFLGIPFAAPPIGSLRFQAAQPFTGSYASVNATTYGSSCMQNATYLVGVANTTMSEDCLSLNVFTPILPSNSSALLPVVVWIYGGGFTSGSSSLFIYDGSNVVSRGNVVVVSINYRVGLLGNLASSTLAGSQGITDQIQALQWVQQHIATFGGDPTKVTLWGESAGAQSIVGLLSSTPAKGLFSAAISESAPWVPFFSREVYTGTNGIYPSLLNATNCTQQTNASSQLSCLQAIPASTYVADVFLAPVIAASLVAQAAFAATQPFSSVVEPWLPTVGTGVIDGFFPLLVRNGTLPSAGVHLMIGNNRDEGAIFVGMIPQLVNPVPYSATIFDDLIAGTFNNGTVAAVLSNMTLFTPNSTDPDELRDLASQVVTLDTWQCPLQEILGFAADQSTFSSLYSFRFDRGVATSASEPNACTTSAPSGVQSVCHSNELIDVFGTSNLIFYAYNNTNSLPFAQYTVDTWTSFVSTYSPQPDAAYLQARGRSYNVTLAYSQATPFMAFNPNTSTAMHVMNTPPSSSGLFYPAQCAALASGGFNYAQANYTIAA